MAYLIVSTDTKTGVVQYAKSVGKNRVVWTINRDDARRFAHMTTADNLADRIMREGWHPKAVIRPEDSAP